MQKPLIIFGVSKPNVYSYAALLGALESRKDVLENYDIKVIRKNPLEDKKIDSYLIKNFNLSDYPFIVLPISLFTSQLDDFKIFIQQKLPRLKEVNNNIVTVVGGWHSTGSPLELLKMGPNYVVKGEAEILFPDLLMRIYNRFHNIQNKSAHFGHEIVSYDQNNQNVVDISDYPPYSEKFRVFSPIEISRGCPFRCKFCQIGCYWPKMRHADIDTVISWVKKAVKIKYDKVWFTSPNSFGYGSKNGVGTNPKAVKQLLSQIRKIPNLKKIFFGTFPSEIRPEYVSTEMIETILPYIDNKYFTIGAQSASDELLYKIRRGHSFQEVLEAVDIITDFDYGVDLDFIFGLPGETNEDIDLNIDFFKLVLKSSKKVRIHSHSFMPLPGTPFENEKFRKMTAKLEKIIGQLATRNKAFGQHQKQANMKKLDSISS